MRNELQIFNNNEFGAIEVLMIDGKPYFPATACAEILGYSKPHDAISRHCRGSVKHGVIDSIGRMQETNFIPEGDLYRLIVRSKLPAAEKFERWVFDEVLPDIRTHGLYAIDELIEDPDFLADVFEKYRQERAIRRALEVEIQENAPKVVIAIAPIIMERVVVLKEVY